MAAIIALVGVGTGVFVAAGGSSNATSAAKGSTNGSKASKPANTGPARAVLSSAQVAQARSTLMNVLGGYQTAYSDHDLSGLSRLFTPGITRHGLAAGGCIVSHGRENVLADYESQFAEDSGSYQLLDLRPSEIQIDSATRGHLHTNYEITPGGTGFVNFGFARLGEGWKISQVYATCA